MTTVQQPEIIMARPKKGITFWDRVYTLVERDGECLIFTGCKDECGYGRINRTGKLVRLHRAVWERDHGPLGKGVVVMHTCDRPSCIEPSHLRAGTQRENIADMDAKHRRRSLVGSMHGRAKLKESDIPRIRAMLERGDTCVSIGKIFGVTDMMIRHIKKKRAWTHVP